MNDPNQGMGGGSDNGSSGAGKDNELLMQIQDLMAQYKASGGDPAALQDAVAQLTDTSQNQAEEGKEDNGGLPATPPTGMPGMPPGMPTPPPTGASAPAGGNAQLADFMNPLKGKPPQGMAQGGR